MKSKINIVWYRSDLRVEDQQSLASAISQGNQVVALFCFDPRQFEIDAFGYRKTAKFRAQFLIETIENLRSKLLELNISLLVHRKTPEACFEEISEAYQITNVYYQKEWTRDELAVEDALQRMPILKHVQWISCYDQFLFHPEDLPFSMEELPAVFTNFRKKLEMHWIVREKANLNRLPTENLISAPTATIPSLEEIGFQTFEKDPRTAFPFLGGEDHALLRLESYFWETRELSSYKIKRNGLVGINYSSKLSPWLANGSISARSIYREVRKYEQTVEKNDSTYWLIFELLWRDYFKCISLKHGNKIFFQSGILNRSYTWDTSPKLVQDWIQGNTNEPFVNANMIELKKTGWMSNRGRQNVASYFAKTMRGDWRIGASYFQSLLLDYDVHSNFGNWMYVAGVGNDPRDRIFNVSQQAKRYDPNKEYQDLWRR